MLTLPAPPDRHDLAAFWIAVCLLSGTVAALAVGLAVPGAAWTAPAAAALVLGTLGAARPEAAVPAYRLWNRAARAFGRRAAWLASGVAWWTVIVPAGLAGGRLPLRRPGADDSVWSPRGTLPPEAYRGRGAEPGAPAGGGWLASLIGWGRRAGQPWLVFLVPSLVLLRGLRTDREESGPSEIYTLY